MAVQNGEVASIVSVHVCSVARPLEASLQLSSEHGIALRSHGDEKESAADNDENQRTSSRSRTPTQRLAESSPKDSTRLIFLHGENQGSGDEGSSSSPSPTNDDGATRRSGRSGAESRRRRGAFDPDERDVTDASPVEGGEKRRRGASGDAEGASSRPKRAAAAAGEAKREFCMDKMARRVRSEGSATSSLNHAASPIRSDAARRPSRDVTRKRDRRPSLQQPMVSEKFRNGVSRKVKVLNRSSLSKLAVVKPGASGKTRLDFSSNGPSSAGKKAAHTSGKSVAKDEDGDDVSTGSSEQSFHRRDWGLMEVDAVGRNRPPFARTMLYHGTVPFPLPADLSDQAVARNWVIKRWPDKTNRRKIDQEVHECIKAHPNPYLVRILDVSPSEGVLMDYWNEGDLHKHMTTARRKFMPVKEIARYMVQLLRGLAHLHKHKVVHCDVSPQNVFLRRDRQREAQMKEEAGGEGVDGQAQIACYSCALGDFGHSYILSQHEESRSGVASQGAGFVAPEVKDGKVSTMSSDIFSAGKIMEELLNLSEGFRETFEKEPKFMVRKLRGLATAMCSHLPATRPNALRVCQKLETLGESIK